MATCDMGFDHEDVVVPEPEPAEPVIVDPGPNENDVKIAEIEAEASIERERIWTEQQEIALAAENESLRGELRGIRETLDSLMNPPEPEPAEPVIIEAPPPEPADDGPPPPPDAGKPTKVSKGSGWWDNYA